MSKKQLNENTIRRFMKLASIDPLTENFLEDIKENEEEITEGEDEITEGEDETIEENQANVVPGNSQLKEEEDEELDPTADLAPPEEPMGDPEMAPVEEPVEGKMVDLNKFMAAFEEALEAQGFPTETELGDEEAPMEAPMEAPVEEEPEEAPANRGVYEELLDDAGVEIIDEDKIVSEVVRRVAKRLVKSKLNK